MSKFRDEVIRGFRNNVAYKGFTDDIIIENLIRSNLCPSQLGLDETITNEHCNGDCDSCWSNVHRNYN